MKSSPIQKQDFNKVISPKSVQKDYNSIRQKSMEPINRIPSAQFAPAYKTPVRSSVSGYPSQRISSAQTRAQPVSQSHASPMSHHSSTALLQNLINDSIDFKLKNRTQALEAISDSYPDFDAIVSNSFSLADEGAIIDILKLINRNITVWSLGMVATILNPNQSVSFGQLILSGNPSASETILETIKVILKYFENTILDNIDTPSHGGIDLQRYDSFRGMTHRYDSF